MNKKWNEKTTFEKTLNIISFVAFCVWMLFELLERTGKMEGASIANYICVFVISIAETIYFWNVKRAISYIGIAGAACLLAAIVLSLM